jgi:hypothetical protein
MRFLRGSATVPVASSRRPADWPSASGFNATHASVSLDALMPSAGRRRRPSTLQEKERAATVRNETRRNVSDVNRPSPSKKGRGGLPSGRDARATHAKKGGIWLFLTTCACRAARILFMCNHLLPSATICNLSLTEVTRNLCSATVLGCEFQHRPGA